MKKQPSLHLALANRAFRDGRYGDAIPLYEEVIKNHPELKKLVSSNIELARRRVKKNNAPSTAIGGRYLADLNLELKDEDKRATELRGDDESDKNSRIPSIAIYDVFDRANIDPEDDHQNYDADLKIIIYSERPDDRLRLSIEAALAASSGLSCVVLVLCDWGENDKGCWLLNDGRRLSYKHYLQKQGYYAAVAAEVNSRRHNCYLILRSSAIVTKVVLKRFIKYAVYDQIADVIAPLTNTGPFNLSGIEPGCDITYATKKADFLTPAHPRSLIPSPYLNANVFLIGRRAVAAIPFPHWKIEQDSSQMSLTRYFIALGQRGLTTALDPGSYVHCLSGVSLTADEVISYCDPIQRNDLEESKKRTQERAKLSTHLFSNNKPVFITKKRVYIFIQSLHLGGGGLVIARLANHLSLLGYQVTVFARHVQENYSEGLSILFSLKYYSSPKHVIAEIQEESFLIATLWTTAKDVAMISQEKKCSSAFYFVQDFEPYFYVDGSGDVVDKKYYDGAMESYREGLEKVFTSRWISQQIASSFGQGFLEGAVKINVGIDTNCFFNRIRSGQSSKPIMRIGAMARPSTPRRGFKLLRQALEIVYAAHSTGIEIVLFGENNLNSHDIKFKYVNRGICAQRDLASIYSSIDIFIDSSDFQGFGLCALEAMGCGCAVITTDSGGIREYCVDGVNSLVVEHSANAIAESVTRLISNPVLRSQVQAGGIATAGGFDYVNTTIRWDRLFDQRRKRESAMPATGRRAVIVPVFNNPNVAIPCLVSVYESLGEGDTLVVVDDFSDDYTANRLVRFSFGKPNVLYFRNERNLGFVGAVNRGLIFSIQNGLDAVLVNSDTLVPRSWLSRIAAAARVPGRPIALVSPYGTSSSHLQIHPLPGHSFLDADRWVEENIREARYPDIITPEGWCLYIPIEILRSIGILDAAFGRGYCEESDLCMRALAAGYALRLCDNLVVYHQGKATFGEERGALYLENRRLFDSRWAAAYATRYDRFLQAGAHMLGGIRYRRSASTYREPRLSAGEFIHVTEILRSQQFIESYEGFIRQATSRPSTLDANERSNRSVVFLISELLPYGGVHSVVSLCNEWIRLGISVKVVVLKSDCYAGDNIGLLVSPVFIESVEELTSVFPASDLLICTSWITVLYGVIIASKRKNVELCYYIQDIETRFRDVAADPDLLRWCSRTYTLPIKKFVKTKWLRDELAVLGVCDVEQVPPSLDLDVFYPRECVSERPFDIVAMYRPVTPHRNSDLVARIMIRLRKTMPQVTIQLFGCAENDVPVELKTAANVVHGVLGHKELSKVYAQSKIFIEISQFHGFGRTIFEAMACGTVCLISNSGGPMEFCIDGVNCEVLTKISEEHVCDKIAQMIQDTNRLRSISKKARSTTQRFDPENSARQIQNMLGIIPSVR
jgi:glycosyltransferase involved in cell wall biosynthesis